VPITREQATGRFADADGIRIHYGDVGAGDPVILLHGAGPGADGYGNFRGNLDDLATRFRLLVPDLPRFGRSDKPQTDKPRLDFLSGAIAAFMDAVGVGRAHFVGNSLGGQTALKLAIDQPERVGRIVVVGSNAMSRSVFAPMPAEAVGLIASYYQGAGPSRDKMRSLLQALDIDRARVTDELVEQRYAASTDPDIVAINRDGHWGRQSLDGELARVQARTLLVWGQDDRASPLDCALAMIRLIPDASLHVFNRCGHWAQVEHAAEFNRLVLEFLAASPRPRTDLESRRGRPHDR
jgi:4,5:9,10-diseco-3-hydroxy-5,9,17-trioxoandrosta-1(10),2-diene-4-oate hydrolase